MVAHLSFDSFKNAQPHDDIDEYDSKKRKPADISKLNGLINSVNNPSHERAIKDIAQRLAPDLPICISYEVLPEIKEHIAYFESTDLRGLSLDQLSAHLDESLQRAERMGALHGVMPRRKRLRARDVSIQTSTWAWPESRA